MSAYHYWVTVSRCQIAGGCDTLTLGNQARVAAVSFFFLCEHSFKLFVFTRSHWRGDLLLAAVRQEKKCCFLISLFAHRGAWIDRESHVVMSWRYGNSSTWGNEGKRRGRRMDARTNFRSSERSAGYTGTKGRVPCSMRSHDLFGGMKWTHVGSDRSLCMPACCFLYSLVFLCL